MGDRGGKTGRIPDRALIAVAVTAALYAAAAAFQWANGILPANPWLLPHVGVARGPLGDWLTVRYPLGWHASGQESLSISNCPGGATTGDCDTMTLAHKRQWEPQYRGQMGCRDQSDAERHQYRTTCRGVERDGTYWELTTLTWAGWPVLVAPDDRPWQSQWDAAWWIQSSRDRDRARRSMVLDRILESIVYIEDYTADLVWDDVVVTSTAVAGLAGYSVSLPRGWIVAESSSGFTVSERPDPWLTWLLDGVSIDFVPHSGRIDAGTDHWDRVEPVPGSSRSLLGRRRVVYQVESYTANRLWLEAVVSTNSARFGTRPYWEDEQVAWRIVNGVGVLGAVAPAGAQSGGYP